MSLFCFCVIDGIKNGNEKFLISHQIEALAKPYNCGIKYNIDWNEPILSHLKNESVVINIIDSPEAKNCELFLLPDGWYFNGQTNSTAFRARMKFLEDISTTLVKEKYNVSFYMGQSGTDVDDFADISIKCCDFVDYLSKTVGMYGIDNGLHVRIIYE